MHIELEQTFNKEEIQNIIFLLTNEFFAKNNSHKIEIQNILGKAKSILKQLREKKTK